MRNFFCWFIIFISFLPSIAWSQTASELEQIKYNSAQIARLGIVDNTIILNNIGNANQIYIEQVGNNQSVSGIGQLSVPITGNNNTITLHQGDTISHQPQNLVAMSVNGNFNSLNLNQGPDLTGTSTGTDQGSHYQLIAVNGDSNMISTAQTGFNHYAEVNITGSYNSQTLLQTGSNHQAYTAINGNNNNLITTQTGSGGHVVDVSLAGNNSGVNVTQTGELQNRATVSITNTGGPTGLNLTQSGGASFYMQQTCISTAGCGITTVKQ